MSIRQPRSIGAATQLLEQFAALEGQIAQIEGERQESIASINARADAAANDLIAQRETIRAKLEPWWAEAGPGLTQDKRKSIELGGCLIGTRAGKVSLAVAGDAKAVAEELVKSRWARKLLRISISLDRRAILAALDGTRAAELEALGFARAPATDAFFVQRAEQEGTRC